MALDTEGHVKEGLLSELLCKEQTVILVYNSHMNGEACLCWGLLLLAPACPEHTLQLWPHHSSA